MFDCDLTEDCLNYRKNCLKCKRNILIGQIRMGSRDYYKSKTEMQRQKTKFKVGDLVSFNAKLKKSQKEFQKITGKIVKINPKKAKMDCGKLGFTAIPYQYLNLETVETSTFLEAKKVILEKPKEENPTLKELMEEVKEEYQEIFQDLFNEEEMKLLETVTIKWNKRKTFRMAGKYRRSTNEIWISISLEGVPKEVIKSTIYHELLHIHFKRHSKVFKFFERKFKTFEECKDYTNELFKQILNGSEK